MPEGNKTGDGLESNLYWVTPHRFLSLTLVVLPCHTTSHLVPDSSGLSSDTTSPAP